MADIVHSKTVTFPEASHADERIAAVLISKDAETGELRSNVRTFNDRHAPAPEAVDMLVNSTEIQNL